MSDEIITTLVASLSAELVKEQKDIKIKAFRLKQYEKIFGGSDPFIKELHDRTLYQRVDQIFKTYTKELLISRPDLQAALSNLEIVPVSSRYHSSYAYQFKGKSFVVIDTITMQFIWMMNKAFLCRLTGRGNPVRLFTEIYLHFATVIGHENFDQVFKKPKTPPHKDLQSMSLLHLMTKTQEKFLLAHEIAHLIVTENDIKQHKNNYSPFTALNMKDKSTPVTEVELAVDKIALDLVIADMRREYPPEIVDFGCEMIFLLVRYFLWLRVVLHLNKEVDDSQFHLWLARNKQLRDVFKDEIKSDFLNEGIIQMLDYLETTQEVGALAAHAVLKTVIAET